MSIPSAQRARPAESQAMQDFEVEAGLIIKRHMIRLGWTYVDLANALQPLGVVRAATVVNRRINRGNFSAGFFLACIVAMQVELELQPKEAQAEGLTQAKQVK